MYHYVRKLSRSRYPDIKGLSVSQFRQQLKALTNLGEILVGSDIVAALNGKIDLPDRAFWLTFDDGYLDHYENVFPLLDEFGVSGTFFPPTKCLRDRFLLDVHAIHFILACTKDPTRLVTRLSEILTEYRPSYDLKSFDTYWTENAHPNRFDTAEIIFVKRMLQVALPSSIRRSIIDRLFLEFVSVDQSAFAEELYMTSDQIRTMRRCGMEFGSHTDSHPWLDTMSAERQRLDIETSLNVFASIDVCMTDWTMCYPYGASTENTKEIAKALGALMGVTTKVGSADLEKDDLMSLPRWDANDVENLMLKMEKF
jgi:peptidoglycan/xylan/chitin deacetylase (PgdA/CDA1 family)